LSAALRASVDSGDLVDPEPFGACHHRRVHCSQRQVAVLVHQVGDAQPVGRVDRLNVEGVRGHVREEPHLRGSSQPGAEQVPLR
jgi:hypothetical protein